VQSSGDRRALATTRPCRAPHHTISDVGLIGDGQVLLPGDASLAHHGMLVLEARPACRRHILEVLRQPLETGVTRKSSRALALTALVGLAERCKATADEPMSG
jgi:magnesium chelatase family protein